jgi:hypothetical protein
MALCGSEGEKLFYPAAADGYGDSIDLKMIRNYLQPSTELQFIGEIARLRAAARRLVTAERARIEIVAAALLQHGTLSGDQVEHIAANDLGRNRGAAAGFT